MANVADPLGGSWYIEKLTDDIEAEAAAIIQKIDDMGHVVINFDGSAVAPRPGEISVTPVDLGALAAQLRPGAEISLHS